MEPAEDDYAFLPEPEVTAPARGTFFQRYADCWWAVCPGKGLVFFNPLIRTGPRAGRRRHSFLGAPQCNTDKRIEQYMAGKYPFPVEVRQFPLVWVEISISDYMER
jgi:hypothetical protein